MVSNPKVFVQVADDLLEHESAVTRAIIEVHLEAARRQDSSSTTARLGGYEVDLDCPSLEFLSKFNQIFRHLREGLLEASAKDGSHIFEPDARSCCCENCLKILSCKAI